MINIIVIITIIIIIIITIIKVVVTGAAGRTGSLVFSKLLKDPAFEPIGIVRTGHYHY